MRSTGLSWLTRRLFKGVVPVRLQCQPRLTHRNCSCTAPHHYQQGSVLQQDPRPLVSERTTEDVLKVGNQSELFKKNQESFHSSDHRALGNELGLFTGHASSPGSPLFQPDGTHVFQKLQAFLRAQYPNFGFREVITPTLYKESLWQQSGHWDNYKDAMFAVKGGTEMEGNDNAHYSLKPMNCPGHCLLFKSQKRSWRDLPIRYADFSPLHRNELSGTLSGLTRVRRFHQDDGHIFCTPDQVRTEIISTLRFVDMVYTTLGVGPYELVLSTKPTKDFIGTDEAWERAESQLRDALKESGQQWKLNPGDGAFYGPKIDIILTDKDGKQHQTATIQLDFQLPQRLELEYASSTNDHHQTAAPVMIHRAILGSLERFMALLIEQYQGHWPFWLSPRQLIVLTVGTSEEVLNYAETTAKSLAYPLRLAEYRNTSRPLPLSEPQYIVDTDFGSDTLSKKIRRAKTKKYNLICILGEKNLREENLDLDISGQPKQEQSMKIFDQVQHGSESDFPGIIPTSVRKTPSVLLTLEDMHKAMKILNHSYL